MAKTQKKASSAQALPEAPKRKDTWNDKIILRSVTQARKDIATWKAAIQAATAVDNPRRAKLQQLYDDIVLDALLTSQLENRKRQVVGSTYVLKDENGEINEELTAALRKVSWMPILLEVMADTIYRGHSLAEFYNDGLTGLKLRVINRRNVEPRNGILLFDEMNTDGIRYREQREFGWWVVEFGSHENLGLLNKAVPHVLFKRFAQSCWSELCEIYGIPPRYIKTNTQDPVMLTRAEQMMRDMGSAAWFIIDDTEELEFANGVSTNGEVYKNLIQLCNNETSMLISGAVIGQDTVNGNRSKEQESGKALTRLIMADKVTLEGWFSSMVMPALVKLGVLPEGLTWEFEPTEDIAALWKMTQESFEYFEVDPDWIKTKFGVQVVGPKKTVLPGQNSFF
jgi:hypothetical protein